MDENQAGSNDVAKNDSITPVAVVSEQGTQEKAQTTKEGSFELNEKTIMAALSYISVLVFIPLLTKKDDPFIMFHVKQGLVVFALGVILWLVGGMLFFISHILQLVVLVFSVIGIVHAIKQEEKVLPIIGKFADHIKI